MVKAIVHRRYIRRNRQKNCRASEVVAPENRPSNPPSPNLQTSGRAAPNADRSLDALHRGTPGGTPPNSLFASSTSRLDGVEEIIESNSAVQHRPIDDEQRHQPSAHRGSVGPTWGIFDPRSRLSVCRAHIDVGTPIVRRVSAAPQPGKTVRCRANRLTQALASRWHLPETSRTEKWGSRLPS